MSEQDIKENKDGVISGADPVGPDPSDKKARIKWLIDRLNLAAKAYYQDAEEIMPNIEYDALYDELLDLEKETGIIFANSPSQNVGYEILSDLPSDCRCRRVGRFSICLF